MNASQKYKKKMKRSSAKRQIAFYNKHNEYTYGISWVFHTVFLSLQYGFRKGI